jgi:hypothetical protein
VDWRIEHRQHVEYATSCYVPIAQLGGQDSVRRGYSKMNRMVLVLKRHDY